MKKINIGIVLILIVGICYFAYAMSKLNERENDRKNIEEFIQEYLEVYNKYSLLPEEDRVLDKEIDEEKYNNYLEEMKEELDKFSIEENKDILYEQYKARLDKQIKGEYMMYEYEKKLSHIARCDFLGNCIRVYFYLNGTVDDDRRVSPTLDEATGRYVGNVKRQKGEDIFLEELVFKKINNEYKIVYQGISDHSTYSFEENRPFVNSDGYNK